MRFLFSDVLTSGGAQVRFYIPWLTLRGGWRLPVLWSSSSGLFKKNFCVTIGWCEMGLCTKYSSFQCYSSQILFLAGIDKKKTKNLATKRKEYIKIKIIITLTSNGLSSFVITARCLSCFCERKKRISDEFSPTLEGWPVRHLRYTGNFLPSLSLEWYIKFNNTETNLVCSI